jgi:hypothetical protein
MPWCSAYLPTYTRESAESITGPITKIISKHGVLKLYNDLSAADKKVRQHSCAPTWSANTITYVCVSRPV